MSAIPSFVGGAYTGKNAAGAFETCVNWFPSAIETPGGVAPVELLPTPGLSVFATASGGVGRAAWAGDGRCFLVFDGDLYELASDGTLTNRGTMAYDANPATISTNGDAGNQLLVTSGGNAYVYDLTANTLTLVIAGDCLMGGVVDGYGVIFGAAQFRISELFDLATWDPTQYALRSIQPDLWQAMLVDPYGYVTLFGSKTSESWQNTGAFPFPFAPDRTGLMEEGIAAPFSVKQAGKHKVWLSTNGNGGYQVIAAQGFSPRRISTHGLEAAISKYASVADAEADTYEHEGHAFYLLTFPTAGVTWAYDFATQQWHQRAELVAGAWTSYRPRFYCHAFGRHLAVDRSGATVWALSDDVYTGADGAGITRERTFYPGGATNSPVFYDRLEIHVEAGVGLTAGSAEDVAPRLALAVSNNYGKTWGVERTKPIGARGQYGQRCAWWGLGQATGRAYRLRSSAAVPVRLLAAYQKPRMAQPLEVA